MNQGDVRIGVKSKWAVHKESKKTTKEEAKANEEVKDIETSKDD